MAESEQGVAPEFLPIRLIWHVQQQYTRTFTTAEEWMKFVEYMQGSQAQLDPDDLDAVYEFFEGQRGMTCDWMEENGSGQYWLNTVGAEIDDLDYVGRQVIQGG